MVKMDDEGEAIQSSIFTSMMYVDGHKRTSWKTFDSLPDEVGNTAWTFIPFCPMAWQLEILPNLHVLIWHHATTPQPESSIAAADKTTTSANLNQARITPPFPTSANTKTLSCPLNLVCGVAQGNDQIAAACLIGYDARGCEYLHAFMNALIF